MTALTCGQYRLPDFVADLDLAYGMSFQVQASEAGSGALSVPLDAGYDIRPNDVLLFSIDDVPVFGWIAETLTDHTLDESEGSAQFTRVEGRGVGAVCEWAVIVPSNGLEADPVEEDRLFSWPVIQYVEGNDGQAWDEVVDVGDASGMVRVPGTQEGYPAGAPDLGVVKWIWASPGDQTDAPSGRVYARTVFTMGAARDLLIEFALDNYGQVYFDGQPIGTLARSGGSQNYLQTHTVNVRASAGTHVIAVTAVNSVGDSTNPGGIYLIAGEIDDDGTFGPVIYRYTNTADWDVLGYPATPPGMTPGEAVGIAIDEARARGGLDFLYWDFDGTADSNGTPWPLYGDLTTKTGTDLLTFLMELSVAYIDWVVNFDGVNITLSLYVKGDYAQVGGSAVALEPAPVNDPLTGNLLLLDRVRT